MRGEVSMMASAPACLDFDDVCLGFVSSLLVKMNYIFVGKKELHVDELRIGKDRLLKYY